MKVWSSLC